MLFRCFSKIPVKLFDYLLLFVPLSLVLAYWIHAGAVWVFVSAAVAIIPLANWIRRGTEQIAKSAGPAIGGLLNVTFGNLSELILAIFVLMAGRSDVVKAQITGSIIGNSLIGLGVAIMVGSWGRERQFFKRERAGLLSSLLILSVIALLLPAFFDYSERRVSAPSIGFSEERFSLGVAVVLIVIYAANLIYTLVTHRDVFEFEEDEGRAEWPMWKSLAVLAVGTVILAVEAELVSDALEATAKTLEISTFFLGITVLAVIGNAAEYVAAGYFARKNRMDLALSITVGSTIQVALLLAPLLVIISYFIGHPMNLVFESSLELIAVAAAAFAVNAIAQDGESTWFEGLLLVAVYVLLGLAFFFVTPGNS